MKTLPLTLLVLLTIAPAFARADGGSIGGGTNLLLNEEQLVDFAKFKDSEVRKFQISPRKFKVESDKAPVYETIKPQIDRAEAIYPGMGAMMEKAFDLPWVVVDAEFPGRNAGERMVIRQTDQAIYVSEKWIRKASPELVRRAFLHEGVRKFAHDLLPMATGKADFRSMELEDEITEALTPPLYTKAPTIMVEEAMNKSWNQVRTFLSPGQRFARKMVMPSKIMSRAEFYADLKTLNGPKTMRELCRASKSYWSSTGSAMKAFANDAHAANPAVLQKYRSGQYFTDETAPLGLDQDMNQAIALIASSTKGSSYADHTDELCAAGKYERFLKEFENSSGKATLGADHLEVLPNEASDASEGSAN